MMRKTLSRAHQGGRYGGASHRLGLAAVGLLVLGGLAGGGCGVGTDPSLLEDPDATAPPRGDAGNFGLVTDAASLMWDTPPIDEMTWDATATASFALG